MTMYATEIQLEGLGTIEDDHEWFHNHQGGEKGTEKSLFGLLIVIILAAIAAIALMIVSIICCIRKRNKESMLSPRVANAPEEAK